MVYAPCQRFEGLYDPDTALLRGTLFSELDLPLEVIEGKSRKNAQPMSTGCAHNCHM
ncbi:MAG: spore coat associated protein CotJA [Clostridia bacterium]|nr:spore coat associated protein CotJA [Clostridia bacterium]